MGIPDKVDWLSGTNILLRSAQPTHPMHRESVQAVMTLLRVVIG